MSDQPQQPQSNIPPPPHPPQPQQPPPGYGVAPQPMSQQDEKTWATLVHLAPFLAAVVGIPFLGPLIVFLIFKDRGPFVRFHAAQALNFQIIITIAFWVFGLLSFVLIGIPFLILTAIAWVVFSIIAAIKANNGEWYRYPMTPELVK
ncbi:MULTISPECIES: DUF4870 domain-containing protein [unclassified Phycicoccus]|jgi:hypothetical protein|uniref:DUF4870 domain-containing protein n=1 Tax=unclassified Phycicoccus TaxID=2637926 RepID=UPI000702D1D8|nr:MULTISPECIES: DUF4870 domain-containing protein [unclassified Phycicoccus]KRF22784.1 hypothetical protein ASG91_15425 [Phycicoccus sp. Soil802]KRF24538.1 hypothetical protein ASG95_08410 [Phycicoccus sp. Soil803]